MPCVRNEFKIKLDRGYVKKKNWICAALLDNSEAKTVVAEADPSKLVADLPEVFSLGYIPLENFIKTIKVALQKASEKKVELKTIDFSRDGYITDIVLKTVFEILPKININACSKVTDAGLALLSNAKNIGNVDAMATNVVHLKKAGNTKGCPLLSAPSNVDCSVHKTSYLLIVPMATKNSLSSFLSSKSAQDRQLFHHLKEVKLSDWNVNITELERNHVLFDHALPPNPTHVIISFDAGSDIRDLKGQIIETIGHILSKEHLNPPHSFKNVIDTNGFFECSSWSKCEVTLDGIVRNTSTNGDEIATVLSKTPLCRTNNYFEIQCLTTLEDTGAIIGALNDSVVDERFPAEVNQVTGMVVEGFQLEAGVTYGLGIKGNWDSEFVPSKDAVFYVTKNGLEMKIFEEKPEHGAYPLISVLGKNVGSVKFLNMASPPQALVNQWELKKQFWSPAFMFNILCDDQGIISYASSYKTEEVRGLFVCQETITKERNTFSVKVVDVSNEGILTVGLGPENYKAGRHPGWEAGSIALHGDDGLIYNQNGGGCMPSTKTKYIWKNGDIVKVVVSGFQNSDTIQEYEEFQVDFYVNNKLIESIKTKLLNVAQGVRMVFMIGIRGEGTKAQILNYRPEYLCPPARMDLLTLGRSRYLKAYDDGRLKYRAFENERPFGLFISKTPFNQQLTYFEFTVSSISSDKHVSIGFANMNYMVNNMLGWLPGSVGYHADNGKLYSNSSTGIDTLNSSSPIYGEGDVVGCGLDESKTLFLPDGTLANQQMIKVFFTKNSIKVHEIEFFYQSDGLYPAANLHSVSDELILNNYYPSVWKGNSDTTVPEKKTSESEGCTITVVGMQENGVDLNGKLQILQQALSDMEFPAISIIDEHLKLMHRDPKMMNLQGQQLYGQLCWQKECLERFQQNKSRLKFMTVDVSNAEGHQELITHVLEVCESDLTNHSNCYELHESVSAGLKKIVEKLSQEKLIAADNLRELVGEDFGLNGQTFEAAVRYLHAKGWLLQVPMKRTIVAIDLHFAQTLVTKSSTPSNILSGKKVPCVGEETRIWNNITDIIPDANSFQKNKMDILSHVLMFMGVMELRCLRDKKRDPMFCYSTLKNIGDIPVNLSDFTKTGIRDTVLVEREYFFLHSSCKNVLSTIISRCLMFARAVVIDKEWCVFQNGAAQTTIFIQGEQGLRVETRCYMPNHKTDQINSDTDFHVQEYAFNVFCLFIDIIDFVIGRLKLLTLYTERVPANMVNSSVGCLHNWGLSNEDYRQTLCTLCGQCCENGRNCPFNGVEGEYQHQCGCDTVVTGCEDCGICQSCADFMWTIRSYLRPNLEVASYGKMRSSQFIPLNATTYDEVEFINLGLQHPPICLKGNTGSELSGVINVMFPASATEVPNIVSLEQHMNHLQSYGSSNSKLMTFSQGDTVRVKLELLKRDPKSVIQMEEDSALEITPVYFTCICRETTVWHDTGIVAYTSKSSSVPVGQFISASPLTSECNSFSFEIVNPGNSCYIAIGVCPRRYSPDRQPGWNNGSFGYHADDGGIFNGMGWAQEHKETCTVGDVMKCEVDFENLCISFYKNGRLMHTTPNVRNVSTFHAAVGFHSVGEVVRLLEKEPWQNCEEEENDLPTAFDSYKYGNMCISPGKIMSMNKIKQNLHSWLMIHNPSKSTVGYKIIPDELLSESAGYLEPNKCQVFRLSIRQETFEKLAFIDVHWFLLESNRNYADVNIDTIYRSTTAESLLKHRLRVKITETHSAETHRLKLATEEPSPHDFYMAEIIKNGISVQKYWLKEGNYVCYLPLKCDVIVRYPKYPTMNQPNGFQKGMRVILDLRKMERSLYAEAVVEEVTTDGHLRLEYSQPNETMNVCMELKISDPEISIKEIEYEEIKKTTHQTNKDGSGNKTVGKDLEDNKTDIEKVAALNLVGYLPRVQQQQIFKLIGSEWSMGATATKKFDMAFAFLPSKLGLKNLCYPKVSTMFTDVDVHMLCFLVDQVYLDIKLAKDHDISLDVPLHFVNVHPITPSPPLSAEQMFASGFNGWVYSSLYSNKLKLPQCDHIFTEDKPGLSKSQ
ncbi:hypothetical protein Btru_062744, partial [Bulinus truncatus]